MQVAASRRSKTSRMFSRTARVLLALFALLTGDLEASAQSKLVLAANGSHIFDAPAASALLKQCSREAPASVTGFWLPGQTQVSKFERALMRKDVQAMMTQRNVPQKSYDRQYTGLIINKKKLIYGNFFPSSAAAEMAGLNTPVVACDGGAQFWGATYDPQADKIVSVEANGSF